MGKLIRAGCVVLVLASAAAGAERLNVDFSLGWGGCYRPMEWTPVEIGVQSNLKEPVNAILTVSAQQDSLNKLTVQYPLVLVPNVRRFVPLVTKLAFGADSCELVIAEAKRGGDVLWRYKKSLWDYSPRSRPLTAVGHNELLIAIVGRGIPALGKISDSLVHNPTTREMGKIYVKQRLPGSLPWDWTGYASLDLLILFDPDWDQFNTHQGKAIAQWVGNGGRLLVVLGARPLPPGNIMSALLPLKLGISRQVELPPEWTWEWDQDPGSPGQSDTVTCWSLNDVPKRDWTAQSYGTNQTLFAHGPVGFGRVGVLAFDPTSLWTKQQKKLTSFWSAHFRELFQDRNVTFRDEDRRSRARSTDWLYQLGPAGPGSNAVLEHLLSIPELRPLSVWWVVLVLGVLALLLGPVNYLVLKRLDRLPLTWVTSAACIALVTVGAYYGVQALRGGAMQVRAVSVQDGVEGTGCAWSTNYSGIFAPASDNYELTDLKDDQWWSGIAPTRGDHVYAREGFGRRSIYCYQYDGANRPSSLPINIWSMQCLMTEAPLKGLPIEASVEHQGRDVTVTIVNKSDVPIRSGCVRLANNRMFEFGSVPRQSEMTFTGRTKRTRNWEEFAQSMQPYYTHSGGWGESYFDSDKAYFAHGSLQRTRAIQGYLQRGAAVVCVRYDQAPNPYGVKKRRCKFNHIRLVRLVVFPNKG